jgi:DNA-directed RNA polymerase beta' subunit
MSLQSVSFTVLSPEHISSLGIKISRPYTRGGDNKGTPYDPLLGVLEHGEKCHTCGEGVSECPGHFGYIELPKAYFNPVYLGIVTTILRCVCHECATALIPKEIAEISGILHSKGSSRLNAYKKKCESVIKCPQCSSRPPKVTCKNGIIELTTANRTRPISATDVYALFLRISSETMTLFGINSNLTQHTSVINQDIEYIGALDHPHQIRPESFLFSYFPVIPPHARPYVQRKGGEHCDDDLTDRYNSILKGTVKTTLPLNDKKSKKNAGQDVIYRDICSLFDNSKTGKDGERKHKGLKERLSGKDGHIQTNAAGKRVDFSARTVIVGAGPLLECDELGVPEYIADILTVTEVVTFWNIEYYEMLLARGKVATVIREGMMINVKYVTKNFTQPFVVKGLAGLFVKDEIERQLQDGDTLLFNRQPTLRVESMQGVSCKIMKGEYTWRLPLGATRAYNADFDGDEIVETGRVRLVIV